MIYGALTHAIIFQVGSPGRRKLDGVAINRAGVNERRSLRDAEVIHRSCRAWSVAVSERGERRRVTRWNSSRSSFAWSPCRPPSRSPSRAASSTRGSSRRATARYRGSRGPSSTPSPSSLSTSTSGYRTPPRRSAVTVFPRRGRRVLGKESGKGHCSLIYFNFFI